MKCLHSVSRLLTKIEATRLEYSKYNTHAIKQYLLKGRNHNQTNLTNNHIKTVCSLVIKNHLVKIGSYCSKEINLF